MKWIFFAVVAQLLLTAITLIKLNQVNDKHEYLTGLITHQVDGVSTNSHSQSSTRVEDFHAGDYQKQTASIQVELAELTLKIEELSYQLSANAQAERRQTKPTTEQNTQQDQLRNELNNLIYAGSVSQNQLDNLQAHAAQLHPSQRKQMFTEIARAVNSGELKMIQ